VGNAWSDPHLVTTLRSLDPFCMRRNRRDDVRFTQDDDPQNTHQIKEALAANVAVRSTPSGTPQPQILKENKYGAAQDRPGSYRAVRRM
jgi:hypothetical protein